MILKKIWKKAHEFLNEMKILKKSIDTKTKHAFFDLIPENADDIYSIYNLIDPGDLLKSLTTRKISINSKTTVKKTFLMEIAVEHSSVDLEAGILFIKGRIVSTHEHIASNQHHTINIPINHRFSLTKQKITDIKIRFLKTERQLGVIIIQSNVFICCEVTQNFVRTKERITFKKGKLLDVLNRITKIYDEKFKSIIFSSKSNIQSDVEKEIKKNKNNNENRFIFFNMDVDPTDIKKCVQSILVDQSIMKRCMDLQFVEELKQVQLFFKRFEGSELVSIGFNEVNEALDYGAIDCILITDKMYKTFDIELRVKIEELLERASQCKLSISIIPVLHYSGEKLDKLGGIVATLKYEYRE